MKRVLLISLLSLALFVACREENPLEFKPHQDSERVSIEYLKSLYRNRPTRIAGSQYITGRVVANDRNGNLRNCLYIADSTGGIAILLYAENMYRRYWVGRQVSLRCYDMWLGSYGGMIQIGVESHDGYEVAHIPEDRVGYYLLLDSVDQVEIIPQRLKIGDCAPRHVSTQVRFDDVQFIAEDVGRGWCDTLEGGTLANPNLQASARHIIDRAGDTLDVYTSPTVDFLRVPVPSGSGSIEGLLSYFNGRYQLRILDYYRTNMEGERF